MASVIDFVSNRSVPIRNRSASGTSRPYFLAATSIVSPIVAGAANEP